MGEYERDPDHAVVIGGSLAGLVAARVLARHVRRVTVIERDRLPDAPVPRRGVPQAHHLHVLLLRGLGILEALFPGLRVELLASGAPLVDSGADMAWLTPAGWGRRFPSGLSKIAFTRDLLDSRVRRLLRATPGIDILEEHQASGLVAEAGGASVSGVRVRSAGGADTVLAADLVVDASGRGSRAPQWLAKLGFPSPEETVVNAYLGYASRLYRARPFPPSPPGIADWKALFIQASPPWCERAGVLFPVEGDRWAVTLAGGSRDYPPGDEVGFLEFARGLPSPLLFDAIRQAEPLSPIRTYRGMENRLRHYERLRSQPEGFVLLGDAVCAFNPVYGQGMTAAALGAELLGRCLVEQRRRFPDGRLDGLARRFQRELARVIRAPWTLATSEDLRYRATVGARPTLRVGILHRFVDEVVALTTVDVAVRARWLQVFHMLQGPSTLLRPRVLLPVLGRLVRRRLPAIGIPHPVPGTCQGLGPS